LERAVAVATARFLIGTPGRAHLLADDSAIVERDSIP
jgi:hypothetical protein